MNRHQTAASIALITISATGSSLIFRYIVNPIAAIAILIAFVAVLMFIFVNSIIKPYYMEGLGVQSVDADVPDGPSEINWEAFPKQRGNSDEWKSNE